MFLQMKQIKRLATTSMSVLFGSLVVATSAMAVGVSEYFGLDGIEWQADDAHAGARLVVVGPAGFFQEHNFDADSPLFLDFTDLSKGYFPDGQYKYEIVFTPAAAKDSRALRSGVEFAGTDAAGQASGTFHVMDGAVTDRALAEGGLRKDQVINDDLIVTFSACIGNDCVNGESFGFDTLRLKENNLRIKFQDTSNSASFPSNDWQITANETTNGGLNKFSIDDIDGGRTPFTLEAGAPSHSLYVDDGGRLGLGTSTPVVDVHVVSGNSPTMRLEQDGSSGFTAQTWDVAGNEANFFIRDVTNGSTLPFRIFPGAPANALNIEGSTGDVGFGTTTPSSALHINRTTGGAADMLKLTNNGGSFMTFENTTSGNSWFFTHENAASGRFIVDSDATAGPEFMFENDGDLEISGGIITGTAGSCTMATPCDGVFHSDYEVPSIESHSASMWRNAYLPAVGPTLPGKPINLTRKTTGILNELEHAHIYIEQLHSRLAQVESKLAELTQD